MIFTHENTTGARLKQQRALKGVTQMEMASALYITRSCLANYEIDSRTPNESMLKAIADYLGVSVAYLRCQEE